jgi:hypothetical protein
MKCSRAEKCGPSVLEAAGTEYKQIIQGLYFFYILLWLREYGYNKSNQMQREMKITHTHTHKYNIRTHVRMHMYKLIHYDTNMHTYIQYVLGGKVNILGDHSIGHSKKKVFMNMCPIPNDFRDRAI